MTTAQSSLIQFTVAAAGGTAPAWFQAIPEGQWVEIAKYSDGRALENVRQIPSGHSAIYDETGNEGSGTSPPGAGLIDHYGGAVTDQSRAEALIVACGGHNSYHGNEGYALGFRETTPKWYRICDSTPPGAQILSNPPLGANADGRLSAVHGWGRPCFGADKHIWMAVDSAGSADYGGSDVWTWDRSHAGFPMSSTAGSAVAHDGTKGPFTNHGKASGTGQTTLGPAVFDRSTNIAWSFSGRDLPPACWYRNIVTGASGSYSLSTSGVFLITCWGIDLYDLGVLLLNNMSAEVSGTGKRLAVFDPATPTTMYTPSLTNGQNWGDGSFQGSGGVYDAVNRKVYVAHPPSSSYGTNAIRVIDVPVNPRTGVFDQRNVTIPGASLTWGHGGTGWTYGNFGLIEDMGTIGGITRQALFYLGNAQMRSTYVMKLPVGGL